MTSTILRVFRSALTPANPFNRVQHRVQHHATFSDTRARLFPLKAELATTGPDYPVCPDRLGITKAGLFIDADNVSYRCAEKALHVARDRGASNLCCIRAYKDWNKEPDDSNLVRTCDKMGIEQIQVNRASGKNSSDIKMCVDIMRLLHTTDMHRFILVTSDSDFRHVLLEIRNAGRVGCVYHGGPNRNKWLHGYADEYIMMDDM